MVQEKLGLDLILMGFGLPGDNIHSPNEKLRLQNYFRGIEAYIHFFDHVAEMAWDKALPRTLWKCWEESQESRSWVVPSCR
jgi:hypothetical protein